MKASLFHSRIPFALSLVLWLMLSLVIVGCANTAVYQHTTTVKASAEELDVNVLGFVSDVHIKDGTVEVTLTSVITFGNDIGRVTSSAIRLGAE